MIRSHTLVSNFFENPVRECHHQQSSSIQYYAFLCYTVSVLQTFTRVVRVTKSVSLRLLRSKVIIFVFFVSMNKGSAGKLKKIFLLIFKLFQFSSGTNSEEIVSDIESNTPLLDDPSVFPLARRNVFLVTSFWTPCSGKLKNRTNWLALVAVADLLIIGPSGARM